ncbi:MAG: hypothetical protein JSW54_00595, partial [Fidelibacterota bacterium]
MMRTFLLLFALLFVSLYPSAGPMESTQLDPEIRFRYPWTPIHERTVGNALEAPTVLDLQGEWDFWPDLTEGHALDVLSGKVSDPAPTQLNIPASSIGWGFDAENSGLFIRRFTVPKSWSKHEHRLKCEGMFERSQIFFNGNKIADHIGWTPFELDITDHLFPGRENTLAVYVTMEGYAPKDRYRIRKGGYPDIGGILRPIWIHAVPPVHVMDMYLIPEIDEQGEWNLEAQVTLLNSTRQPKEVSLKGSLISATGQRIQLDWLDETIVIPADGKLTRIKSGLVGDILPWTAESPNLYHFVVS